MNINLEFFKTLYQKCDTGKIELRALPSTRQASTKINFIRLDEMDEINTFCNRYNNNNLYVAVALRDGKAGKRENITQIPAVFCDVDFKDTPKEKLKEKLKKFPFKTVDNCVLWTRYTFVLVIGKTS